MKFIKIIQRKAFILLFAVPFVIMGCSENIDESNLYTFTGETIEDYLANREDQFGNFNYLLKRIGYDKILSAYGTYTCFAPTNEAVIHYIDSLYDDVSNADNPHNGMTQRGLEGLTDSLCKDIALFHLLYSEVMAIDLGNGMTMNTMLGRDINSAIDSITGSVSLNNLTQITSMDNELENGVLHVINNVITRSNNLISGELEKHPEFSIFNQALTLTGLSDSLSEQERKDIIMPTKIGTGKGSGPIYMPEECKLGYTIFAETDEVYRENGINNLDDLIAYANNVYKDCASADGWYDYYRNRGIQVSTGTDYRNANNALNMFVRYHILKYIVPYSKMVYSYNETSKVPLYEYYETMLPYTLFKSTRSSGKILLNRWVTNNTLTDRVAEMASASISTVMNEGIEMKRDNIQALNGYLHPISGMLVYAEYVPRGVLNERMRFDDLSLLPEVMSSKVRFMQPSEVRALLGQASGTAFGGNGNMRLPRNFTNHLVVYNGDNTEIYYLPGQDCNWPNYQGDELLCMGAYDFSFRLPPVPDGTYELRMGYTANQNRGMVQFYLGRSSSLTSMKALDIPLDMRKVPVDNADGSPDNASGTGWCLYTKTDDMGVESDANMHNLGWMRGPLYYARGKGGSLIARADVQDLRRIIAKMQFEQGEYWLRFKTVLPDNTSTEFHLDYIELCPENIYNNTQYVEDMY